MIPTGRRDAARKIIKTEIKTKPGQQYQIQNQHQDQKRHPWNHQQLLNQQRTQFQ